MRGISAGVWWVAASCRIIPAGAGHFVSMVLSRLIARDHPRRCGAFKDAYGAGIAGAGSSPQVRGISPLPLPCTGGLGGLGIIPAGAGHLRIHGRFTVAPGDHPRRCGAFAISTCACAAWSGSSPQVRGICGLGQRVSWWGGIIPAGAGHFNQRASQGIQQWDHPRRCGAFIIFGLPACGFEGSSPQVRGI